MQIADYGQSQGMQIAYHHHMDSVVQSNDDIDLFMAHTGESVGLLLDTGHIANAGGDPIAVLTKHKERVNHVHYKDIRADILKDSCNRNISFLNSMLNGVFTVPGDGCIDYLTLFKGLKDINYNGWLVVEAKQDPCIANPMKYATLGADNLKRLSQEAGLVLSE